MLKLYKPTFVTFKAFRWKFNSGKCTKQTWEESSFDFWLHWTDTYGYEIKLTKKTNVKILLNIFKKYN